MPLIHVNLFEGRTVEQKREFAVAVTADAVAQWRLIATIGIDLYPQIYG